jgi:hypothetical protein
MFRGKQMITTLRSEATFSVSNANGTLSTQVNPTHCPKPFKLTQLTHANYTTPEKQALLMKNVLPGN